MASIGRNDRCHCGSGKKYKTCCLQSDDAARRARLAEMSETASGSIADERAAVIGALGSFAERQYPEVLRLVAEVFLPLNAFEDESGEPFPFDSHQESEWLYRFSHATLFDFPASPSGETVAEVYLRRKSGSLTPTERAWILKMLQAPVTPLEVLEVQRDVGVRVRNLWSGAELFVSEKKATHQLGVWDLLAGRMTEQDSQLVFEGGLYYMPPSMKSRLEVEMAKFRREVEAPPSGEMSPLQLKLFSGVMHAVWNEYMLEAYAKPRPQVRTVEGDEIEFTTVVFDLHDADSVKKALRAREDIVVESGSAFGWVEPLGEGGRRSLGRIVIRGSRLTLETQSKPRADRGRAILLALVPGALSVNSTKSMSVDVAIAKHRVSKPKSASRPGKEIPPELAAEAIREFKEKHYRGWLDLPLPALNGATPREAAQTSAGRRAVADVLKTMENSESRGAGPGQPPYDFGWIWKELRLQRL